MPEIQCPNCGERLDVPVELLGQTIRCGACQYVIDEATPPPAALQSQPQLRQVDSDDEPPRKKRSLKWLWVLLGIGGLSCAGCCGGLGYLAYQVENPKWTKYSAPDGRFSYEYPGDTPKTQAKVIPIPEGNDLTMTLLISDRKLPPERYAVGVCELPKAEGKLSAEATEEYLDACLKALQNQPGVAVKQIGRTKMTLFGQPGLEYTGDYSDSSVTSGRVTRRLFILNGRLYMLSALGKDGGPDPEKVKRFFGSFTPTDAAKKQ